MILGRIYEVMGSRSEGPCESVYMLEGSPDRVITLSCDAPIGKLIWMQLVGNEVTSWCEQECPEPAPLDTIKRVRVALLRCYRDDEDQASSEEKAIAAARSVESFWRTRGWGVFSVEVEGFALKIEKDEPMPDRGIWCEASIERMMQTDQRLRDWDPHKFCLWGNLSASYCGWGQRPGKYCMVFASCGVRTICHELGHNLGLHHSNGYSEGDADGAEYGNTHCVMGRGTALSGAQSRKMRLIGEQERIELNKSRRFLMAPMEGDKEDLHSGMFVQAIVSRGSRTYVITMHEKFEITIEKDAAKPIRMHKLVWNGEPVSATIEDFTVTYEGLEGGYALVNVDMGDGLGDQSIRIPSNIPPAMLPESPSEALSGVFWHPELDGQGFALGTLDGKLTLMWYTFNPRPEYKQRGISQRWFRVELDGKEGVVYTGTRDETLRECGILRLSFADEDTCLAQYRLHDDVFEKGVRNGSIWLTRLTGPMTDSVLHDDGSALMQFELVGKQVTLEQGWREPALDYLSRPVRGDVNQAWTLKVDAEEWVPENGRFMHPVDPIMD